MILHSKIDLISDLWQQLELASKLQSDLQDTVDGQEVVFDFKTGKTHLILFDWCTKSGAVGVIIDGSVFEEKSSFNMLGLTFFSKLNWGSYIVSIAITVSKKMGSMIRSMKFLSPEVAVNFHKFTIQPCLEYYCHVWTGAPSCYRNMLDKLQKLISKTAGTAITCLNSWLIIEM